MSIIKEEPFYLTKEEYRFMMVMVLGKYAEIIDELDAANIRFSFDTLCSRTKRQIQSKYKEMRGIYDRKN